MATVKNLYFEIVTRVDPKDSNQAAITIGNVGTVDGESFTKLDILYFYNEARLALLNELRRMIPIDELDKELSQSVITKTQAGFGTDGVNLFTLTYPDGYIRLVSFNKISDGERKYVLPNTMRDTVASGKNPHFSNKDMWLFEQEDGLFSYGKGSNADWRIAYLGLEFHTISDVTTGTKKEAFHNRHHSTIIQLACAIANERGNADPNALARALLQYNKQEAQK